MRVVELRFLVVVSCVSMFLSISVAMEVVFTPCAVGLFSVCVVGRVTCSERFVGLVSRQGSCISRLVIGSGNCSEVTRRSIVIVIAVVSVIMVVVITVIVIVVEV